jgi:VIT1/CCC1 family predicted Fe2+/Mn2+ transporter
MPRIRASILNGFTDPMTTEADLARYRQSLKTERDAAALYAALVEAEPNPDLQKIYRRLANTELQHAEMWAEKLRAAGEPVPEYGAGWRTAALGWLAKRFGPAFVLPTIADLESKIGADYGKQTGPEATAMVAESQSHARLFRQIARTTRGLEGSAVARFEGRHRAAGGNALRAGVLGANDGLVSVFSLVMGVAGAGVATRQILLTGFAGLLAGALSMALGEWLSVQSSRELYQHQIGIEKRELEQMPEEEMEELALIYQAKGIAPDEARRLAERLLSDDATALDTLAREELNIDPAELGGSAWEAAITSFILFAVGAVIPVFPYLIWSGAAGVVASTIVSVVGLFAIGAAITLMTGRNPLFSGLRQVAFGLAAATITFGIGRLIGVSVG